MHLIINGEPYTTDVPEFEAARWIKRKHSYNLELLQDDEVVLTFHDIAEQDKGNYRLADGDIEDTEEIDTLKAELAATDYKIIKCSEYALAGLSPPYDITALHELRQMIRDEINKLEPLGPED